MSCKNSKTQVTVSDYFRDRLANETLRDWIKRHGSQFPVLPLVPVATRIESDRVRGAITWLPMGQRIWPELLGYSEAISDVKLDKVRPDVVSYQLFLKNQQPGLWMVRLCGCAEVIAYRAGTGPPCRKLAEHECALLVKKRRKS